MTKRQHTSRNQELHKVLDLVEADQLHTMPIREVETILLTLVAERIARRLFIKLGPNKDVLRELGELCVTDIISLLFLEVIRRRDLGLEVGKDLLIAIGIMEKSNWIAKEISIGREAVEYAKDHLDHAQVHIEELEQRHADVELP